MSSQKVITMKEKIEALIKRDIEIFEYSDLYDIFDSGCIGYSNMLPEQIDEHYDNYILLNE